MRIVSGHFRSTRQLRFIKSIMVTLLLLAMFWLSFLVLTAGLALGQSSRLVSSAWADGAG
jgi:hypothetical protein